MFKVALSVSKTWSDPMSENRSIAVTIYHVLSLVTSYLSFLTTPLGNIENKF